MILWCDGGHDAAENMRRDRALLDRFDVRDDARPPAVLRLFTFEPPGITLGYAQDPARTLDLDRCRAAGLSWAVRPTGGRAILHVEEWTYSLSAALEDPEWGGSLSQAYGSASRLVLGSLRRLGVAATLAARARDAGRPLRGAHAACFASAARHEILLSGRKLVGSAQRRNGSGLLQQGSILTGPGHLRLPEFLAVPETDRAVERAGLAAGATHASVLAGAPLTRWAEAIEGQLGGRVRRFDGASGGFLLTTRAGGSYTPRSS